MLSSPPWSGRCARAFPALLLIAAFAGSAPSAHALGLHAVATADGAVVWAVGDSGRWQRSDDGGHTWTAGTLGSATLRGVAAHGSRVIVVGDSGAVWTCDAAGGAWRGATVPGAPVLRAVEMPDDSVAFAVGDSGACAHVSLPTLAITRADVPGAGTLDAARFIDAQSGWVAGGGGFVAQTTDGGASWTPRPTGDARELFGVDVVGTAVWVVGERASAWRSLDAGRLWEPVPLALDAQSDVRAVRLRLPASVTIAGGGGFLRASANGGATWQYPVHEMHGRIVSLAAANAGMFACSDRNLVVIASADQGATWRLPDGVALERDWCKALDPRPGWPSIHGHTLQSNPFDPHVLVVAIGLLDSSARLYRSADDGDHWSPTDIRFDGAHQVNALLISPRDTLTMVAAVADPHRVIRSSDGGRTWQTTLTHGFGDTGIPLAMHPDHPDTIFFAGDSSALMRSTDFGTTWTTLPGAIFRMPCDIVVVPDSGSVILVGDGVTASGRGTLWRSIDGGESFTVAHMVPGSEVPGLAVSRLRNATAFGTAWGTGGVLRSPDYGATWPTVSTVQATWGVDIARDDPNVVVFGTFDGSGTWISDDGGSSFAQTSVPGVNFSFYARDRETILAEMADGIWKMMFAYGPGEPPVGPGPGKVALAQNAPNPCRGGATTIRYSLGARGPVTLDVLDLSGRRVARLLSEIQDAGAHAVSLGVGSPLAGLPPGVYLYRLQAGEASASRKLVLLR